VELKIKDKHLSFKSKINSGGKIMKQAIFTKSLTLSVPPEQYDLIKQITDAKCISMAEWVREAIAAALEKEKQKEDEMNE
jgi:hypothetical protein